MLNRRVRIFISLTLALIASYFLESKVFLHNTPVVRPQVYSQMAQLPSKIKETSGQIIGELRKKTPLSPTPPLNPSTQPTFYPQPSLTGTTRPTQTQLTPTSQPIATPTLIPTSLPAGGAVAQFAQCLTSRGMKMYGTPTCGSCASQRRQFGSAFSYIIEINCSTEGRICDQKGIRGYPSWEDGSGQIHGGELNFSILSQISGCPMPTGLN